MIKWKFLLLTLLVGSQLYGQEDIKFTPFASVSLTKVYNSEPISIRNFPHTASQWKVLDGSKFGPDDEDKPLGYRIPLSLQLGANITTSNRNILGLCLSYAQYTRTESEGYYFRYADQVNPLSGFTMPTSFILDMAYFKYGVIGFNSSYLTTEKVGRTTHRIGVGASVQRVVSSKYFLNHTYYSTVEKTDFEAVDLTLKDKVWIIQPKFLYQLRLYENNNMKVWFASQFGFNLQNKYQRRPLGHIWNTGIVVELVKI